MADVGNPLCHGVRAVAPEAGHGIRVRSHVLGPGQQMEGGVRRGREMWSCRGGKGRGGDNGVDRTDVDFKGLIKDFFQENKK